MQHNYRLLLITGNKGCVDQVSGLISEDDIYASDMVKFELLCAETMQDALEHLAGGNVDIILLDIENPETGGLQRVTALLEEYDEVPLVVLTGSKDTDFGVRALEKGAQDYLVKAILQPDALRRSVRYAIERHRLVSELKRRALIDDLTGLYNRRGFFYLGEHALSLAERNNTKQFILFADVDDLKVVNDTRGHEAGDRYLIQAAEYLRHVFRGSDILARIGGDEFAVIAQAVSKESILSVRRRFDNGLLEWNRKLDYKDQLSMSVGIVFADKPSPAALDAYLAEADHLMYREKGRKK